MRDSVYIRSSVKNIILILRFVWYSVLICGEFMQKETLKVGPLSEQHLEQQVMAAHLLKSNALHFAGL